MRVAPFLFNNQPGPFRLAGTGDDWSLFRAVHESKGMCLSHEVALARSSPAQLYLDILGSEFQAL